MKPYYLLILSLLSISFSFGLAPKNNIKEGRWHAELEINDSTYLPFFMEYSTDGLIWNTFDIILGNS